MHLSEFDYNLPKEFIAQRPLENRDESKLMVLNRADQTIEHHQFFELPDILSPDSVLVFNESKVIPARLKFKLGNGNAEILLIKPSSDNTWECMVKPGHKFGPKTDIQIDSELNAHVKDITPHGLRVIKFHCDDFDAYLKKHGHTPTPPYIKEEVSDPEKYQTIYAKTEGSVAAPTAGFHFTDKVFKGLKEKGIQTEFITLHVGLGTFQPVKVDKITEHKMHSEWFSLPEDVAERLNKAKEEGKKIIAVGTTSIRVLESCADNGVLIPKCGETDIFIYPGYKWKFVNQMITNFHVPKSTLLMLVSSFANRDFILKAYETAKEKKYRFFSFGDAMLIK
ncbi:tRNA preQ1(34) S-adenosylmethionine ribosyltransferase-isomerase QueA [Patescibacteria group bacterium]|nr:tRNA preQ1(34) S-adenosylmethionine ribosyltransferase-isomerase QueA [Patescibacteria group bacterium]MBU1683750.1 tRNA preQ1(34) S-adenosylmethionine ribosyltransferase-isomerase QueA [Patescibacteria group bacterium]MBU1934559.1 tRNA preQ1(34) S-adenosylmethionine ribosyltransferase-isomerase QueA [Patescibacteria group bacterium]